MNLAVGAYTFKQRNKALIQTLNHRQQIILNNSLNHFIADYPQFWDEWIPKPLGLTGSTCPHESKHLDVIKKYCLILSFIN